MLHFLELSVIYGFAAFWLVLMLRYGAANRAWFGRYMAPKMNSPEEAVGVRVLFRPDADPETERLRTVMVDRMRLPLLIFGGFLALFLVFSVVVLLVLLAHAIIA